jgi:DNA-binding transcriptional ArsR family regulator
MVEEKLIFNPKNDKPSAHRVLASSSPTDFRPAFGDLGQKILSMIAERPRYPADVARELQTYHQTVYYHVRRLEKAGLIRRVGTQEIRGGKASLFALATDGYAVEFNVPGVPLRGVPSAGRSRAFEYFFQEFIAGGDFRGWVVVGSPVPHGPSMTQGRDGHYAVQLGFSLGQYVQVPRAFPVKLDTDLRNEKLEKSNLIVVGGPRTNVIAAELNEFLPVRFKEGGFWSAISDETGRTYTSELDSVVAKISNPWDPSSKVIIVAGLSGAGTKGAVIGLTNLADEVLRGYNSGDFAAVMRGVDRDGDGKVDSVDVQHVL